MRISLSWSLLVTACVGAALTGALLTSDATAATCSPEALTQVSEGGSGSAVTNLQQCLIQAGFSIPAGATGYYGGQTKAAVQAFYKARMGISDWHGQWMGPKGRSSLAGAPQTTVAVEPVQTQTQTRSRCSSDSLSGATLGTSGTTVKELQTCLIDAGYSIPAGATGYYGGQTVAAVQAFYRARLGLADWHGKWIGPKGRSTLAAAVPVATPVTPTPTPTTPKKPSTANGPTASDFGYKRVRDEKELATYVTAPSYGYTALARTSTFEADTAAMSAPLAAQSTNATGVSAEKSTRQSTTNVQVVGIDEPDIVKTDGEHLYVSTRNFFRGTPTPMPVIMDDMARTSIAPEYQEPTTKVVDAYPLEDLGVISDDEIVAGEMLLADDMLLVFAGDRIVAYDVSNPSKPDKDWERSYGERTRLVAARLMDDTVYLVMSTYLNRDKPCPPVPLMDAGMRLPCSSVWVPERVEQLNTSYSILKLDPGSGSVDDSLTVAGDAQNTVVAMFPDNIYLTHRVDSSQFDVLYDFLEEETDDLLSASVRDRLRTIRGYDISDESKQREMSTVLEDAISSMSDDERLRFENEFENRLEDYLQKRVRDLTRTAVARISTASLAIKATKTIPGHLLNQFALDEYDEHLRVAVTIGDQWRGGGMVNDVYVLDADLEMTGSVTDLGVDERIYSVRFIGERGYVVTFRQIDPFYVLDLEDPAAPEMVGELKIPGFSSYLEAIDDNTVLGVGRDNNKVKLSLFNVRNTARPVEQDVYRLDEYWSEAQNNHHAFLRDSKHQVVFIPGGQGGYVFSYANDELVLKAAVAGYAVRRAVFLDDYLYIVGDNEITVLDENTWKEVGSLTFVDQTTPPPLVEPLVSGAI